MGIPKLLENIKAESQFGVRSCVLEKVFEHRKSKLKTSIIRLRIQSIKSRIREVFILSNTIFVASDEC